MEYYLLLAKSSPDNFTPVQRFIALSKRNPPDPPPWNNNRRSGNVRSLESGNLLNEDLRPFLDGGCSRPLAGYPISARPSCIYACLFSREMRLVTKAPRVVRLARQREREREREYRNKRRRRRGIAKRNNPIRREVVALALEGSKKVPDWGGKRVAGASVSRMRSLFWGEDP